MTKVLFLSILGNLPSHLSSYIYITEAVSRFSADLKAKYKCSPIASDKWPPTPSKEYVRLEVVEGSACREDYIGHVMEGHIDRVSGKETITEEQILDLCVEQVGQGRVIVIEGAPGIGKSTLAWELCRKWEEHAGMEVYSLVILLRLREKRVQNISNVSSLFYGYQQSDRMKLVDEVQKNQGKGVLFVLDGFDELPKSLQHESVLVDLLQKSILPLSTAIVTTRPSVLDNLLTISEPVIEKRVKILGFSQQSIEAYASSAFASSRSELQDFREYISISQNPAINSVMYVPLYAAFVVTIYKSTTSKRSLPRTITQLYTQLSLTILNRHLKTKTMHSPVRKFQNLPDSLGKQLFELSKLAYEGFEKEEVIFHSDIGEHFGFLDAVPDLYGGCDISFNFLHLTLQEFFAAYHISHMSDNGAELFKTKGEDKRWNVVWRFVAGLTGFKFLDSSPTTFSKQEGKLTTFFILCLFEAHSVKLDFQSIFGKEAMVCSDVTTNLDYYALGYCIANCTTNGSSWGVIFEDPFDHKLYSFTQGLMSNKSSNGAMKLLHVRWISFHMFKTHAIKHLYKCIKSAATSPLCSVTDFNISNAKFTSQEEKMYLFELIKLMPNLTTLNISRCQFDSLYHLSKEDDGLLKLLQYLPHSKVASLDIRNALLEYFLEESPFAEDYHTAIQSLTSPLSSLKTLQIESKKYLPYRRGYQMVISSASLNSSLTKLSMQISDSSLLNVFNTDNRLTHLEIVYDAGAKNWPGLVPDVTRIIQHNTTLETLVLKTFDSEDSNVLRDITTALWSNEKLESLHLHVRGVNTELESYLQAIGSQVVLHTHT